MLTEQTLEFLYLFQSLRQIPGLSRDIEAMNANKKIPSCKKLLTYPNNIPIDTFSSRLRVSSFFDMNTLLKKTGDRDTSLLARGCWDDITSSSLDLISGVMSRLKERIENLSLGVILVIKCPREYHSLSC